MNLHKVWAVIRHEYAVNIQRWGFIIMTLIVPLGGILFLLVGVLAGKTVGPRLVSLFGVSTKHIAVVDRSGLFSPILPEFRQDFTLYPDFDAAKAVVDQKKAVAVLLIPSDYLQRGVVRVYSHTMDPAATAFESSDRVRSFFIAHLAAPYVPTRIFPRLVEPVTRFVPIEAKGGARGGLAAVFTFVVPYLLGMLLVISIFVSSGYLLQGVAEEKENRLVELILSSINPMEWFLGKVLGLGAVGLTQVIIWVASALALSGGSVLFLALALPPLPLRVWLLIPLYYILGYVLFATLYAGLAALGTSMRESQQVAGIISFVAAIPFMVSGVLFTSPNAPLIRAVSIFPLTSATMMIMRLSMMEVPTVDIVASLAGLVVSIPLALWFGAKLFRFGILIYGKRPGLREIWAGLRAA